MIQDIEKITRAIDSRTDRDSLYLCGPFDSEGEPASADIHILALCRSGGVKDLHFLAGSGGFQRRIEVSVVPVSLVEAAARVGVADWLLFYTLDKMLRGRPIAESAGAAKLRGSLTQGMKLKPSFYAQTMKNLTAARHEASVTSDLAERGLRSNLAVLLALCLYSLLHLKRPFARNSDLLAQTGKAWRRGDVDSKRAESILHSGRRFLKAVLKQHGFDVGAVAGHHLNLPGEEEPE